MIARFCRPADYRYLTDLHLETTDGIAPTLLGLQPSAHLSMPSRHLYGRAGWTRTGNPRNQNPLHYLCATAQLFGGGGWSRTNNVNLSEQIYSLPQHHRRCRPSKLFGQ